MRAYKVYCLDGAGKLEAAHLIETNSDDGALEAAREISDEGRFEVWRRDRFVGRGTLQ